MPTRIDLDLDIDSDDVLLRLIELGALDIDTSPSGGIAAILPEELPGETVARMLGVPPGAVRVSAATGYDDDSVWIVKPRPVSAGRFRIVPAGRDAEPGAIRLAGGTAFGTGLHPTTALCLEVLTDELEAPLIDLAPAIVRLMARSGTLVLSGIRLSLADEVKDAYRHLGMHPLSERMREGWAALTLRTSW